GPRREQPVHELALVVGLPPRHHGSGLDRPPLDRVHDLGERLPGAGVGVARPERAEVRPEHVQHVHAAAPISCSTARSSSSVTPSTIVGSPIPRSRTNRTPPWNFLSIRKAVRMSCDGGSGPSVSSPTELRTRTVRPVSSSPASPLAVANRAAKTIPIATASPWDRPAHAPTRARACPSVFS